MSDDQLVRRLDVVIRLLESMPERIIASIEKREEIKKAIRMKELTDEMHFLHEHNKKINKMMFSIDSPTVKIKADNPEEQVIAGQMAAVYNAQYIKES